MADTPQMLDNGQGTPYLALFDGNQKPIIDLKNNLPIGMLVSNFVYEYDEEEDEKAEIVIETDNVDLLDQPEFGDKMPLILQWGFILPDGKIKVSPLRKVIIRDTEWEGTENGVRVTLKCTDVYALAKTRPVDRSSNGFEEWVKHNLFGIETKFIDYKVKEVIKINDNKYTLKKDG